MSDQQRQVTLSRFFNENVQLVAKMCPRCYEENEDVKILAINLSFLKFAYNNSRNLDIKTHNYISDSIGCLNTKEEVLLGFTKEEIDKSLEYKEKLGKTCDTITEELKKLCDHNNNNDKGRFLGFSDDEVNKSREYCRVFEETSRSVRYKVYKRVRLTVLNNVNGRKSKIPAREEHRKSIRRKQDKEKQSVYFKDEVSIEKNCTNNFSKPVNSLKVKLERNARRKVESEPNDQNGYSKYFNDKIKDEPEIKCEHIKEDFEANDFETEYFKALKTDQSVIKIEPKWMSKSEYLEPSFSDSKSTMWIPPRSPHNLIEEVLYHDPWALLVATIFLNRTSCMCARPFVFWFLKENPHPLKVLERCPEELEKYFIKLGLQRTRAVQVWRMSHDFLHKDWMNVKELYGIGNYGADAFRLFCQGDFSVKPRDRFLRIYKAWYEKVRMGDGMGKDEEKVGKSSSSENSEKICLISEEVH